jgi:hypothetical protein
MSGSRSRLTRGAAVEAILDGTEKITKETRCSRWLLDRPRARRFHGHDRSGASPGAASPEAGCVAGPGCAR